MSMLRAVLLNPVVARPGYWFATVAGYTWGFVMSRGHVRHTPGIWVATRMPKWSFGRGGTTIGAVYLTRDNDAPAVLDHEAVHREQWRHYGLVFIPLYIRAGTNPRTNRFEIEAGLEEGGYA